jgi:hypothetical protein
MKSGMLKASGELVVGMPLQSIREIVYSHRTFNEWIEIRNISLHPGQKTIVQIVTSDDPPGSSTQPR